MPLDPELFLHASEGTPASLTEGGNPLEDDLFHHEPWHRGESEMQLPSIAGRRHRTGVSFAEVTGLESGPRHSSSAASFLFAPGHMVKDLGMEVPDAASTASESIPRFARTCGPALASRSLTSFAEWTPQQLLDRRLQLRVALGIQGGTVASAMSFFGMRVARIYKRMKAKEREEEDDEAANTEDESTDTDGQTNPDEQEGEEDKTAEVDNSSGARRMSAQLYRPPPEAQSGGFLA
eukprot:TRINITY_DN70186_c0_g1_i1.p2 TRINITY_DN70186_c0_g1~~TRINITY_DN70186_c0_g1_i1.p2  ORF type:complete len:236 (-),score=42.33 TRINITY_DN70186_c0_g1_i1:36-743(-)